MEPPRDRALLGDLAVVLATLAWPLVLWQEAQSGAFDWPQPRALLLHGTVTVLALAIVAVRRRHPTAVALALLPLSASAFVVVPAMVALYALAAHRGRRTAIVIAAAYVGVTLVGAAVMDPPDSWPQHVVTMVAFHAVPVALGMVRAARLELLREYADRALHAEAEQELRVAQARRAERQRIAREMHDVVAHRLSLVSLHAGGLAYAPGAPSEEVAETAEVIRASAHEALDELRGVIQVLRDGPESAEPERPQPTLDDVPALVERCRAAGTRLSVTDGTTDVDSLPPATARTAYRVLEEGLTNAAKHAPRAPVDVRLDRDGDRLVVEVVNSLPLSLRADGGATAVIPGAGAGLVGLTERVALCGGHVEHGATGDGRFRLRAELPWRS